MSQVQIGESVQSNIGIFYFKSYGKIIGSAGDLKDLIKEMRRLEYKIRQLRDIILSRDTLSNGCVQ